ncbi:MAG: hypothetical protein CVU31_18535 [Betaproteobacteria bacterium HGW-Betaproteobacteria-4]|jgi:hypothetical protein|nr:MAG: hypothetical protein CVU31_18535 [Betaproteobacteria bacterium HGW-Betaproteobacteria-4]
MSGSQASTAHWWSEFEAVSLEAGNWLWGTVQGAFNEKASLSQIVVDAVVGMIPLVGDVTAVRDLIAVTIGMVDEPAKREDKFQWALLVVLLFALIPVIGGVIKGVGRISIGVAKSAAKLSGAARAAYLAQSAKDIVAFLNRLGKGHAEKWLLQLRFADHEAAIIAKFSDLVVTINKALAQIKTKLGAVIPESFLRRIDGLSNGLNKLKSMAAERIPQAIKELDKTLKEIQAYVRTGGETTARTVEHTVSSGTKAVTYADELRLIENAAEAQRSAKGGWLKNSSSSSPKSIKKFYTHEAGYPDLTKFRNGDVLTGIPAFAGKIQNRTMKPGEEMYRFFGPKGVTHGELIGDTAPGGGWWGLGAPPKTAKEWREKAAVLDEWNRDGYLLVAKVTDENAVKACVGKISEQMGKEIPGQYLGGGGLQAVIEMDKATKAALKSAGDAAIATGKPQTVKTAGMTFELRPTGWTDANGIWGYIHMPGAGTVQTARLGAREQAAKDDRDPKANSRISKQ